MKTRRGCIVMLDTERMTVEHVYLSQTRKAALTKFMKSCRLDPSYSDMKDEMEKVLRRYAMVEVPPHRVSHR